MKWHFSQIRTELLATVGSAKFQTETLPDNWVYFRNTTNAVAVAGRLGLESRIDAADPNPRPTISQEDYDARREDKADRLQTRALKAQERSDSAHQRAHDIGKDIPFGQPILVGHHSERHARADVRRIDNAMRTSVEEGRKAESLQRRADAATSNTTVYSDDPGAVSKLETKLAKLEETHKQMKDVNRHYKKGTLKDIGWSEDQIARATKAVTEGYSWNKAPYPGYALTNSSANMRQVKKRIGELKRSYAGGFPLSQQNTFPLLIKAFWQDLKHEPWAA